MAKIKVLAGLHPFGSSGWGDPVFFAFSGFSKLEVSSSIFKVKRTLTHLKF